MSLHISDDEEWYVDDAGERYVRVSRVLAVCGVVRRYFGNGDSSRLRGRRVHEACEIINKTLLKHPEADPATILDPTSVDERIKPYIQAYLGFLHVSGFVPIASEVTLGSLHGFAGTIDCVGQLNGRLALIDFKTGESVDSAFDYQTGAYELLWNENNQQLIQARFALQLKKNGKHKLHPAVRPAEQFLDLWDQYLSSTQSVR